MGSDKIPTPDEIAEKLTDAFTNNLKVVGRRRDSLSAISISLIEAMAVELYRMWKVVERTCDAVDQHVTDDAMRILRGGNRDARS
jgi:hypothetical protein